MKFSRHLGNRSDGQRRKSPFSTETEACDQVKFGRDVEISIMNEGPLALELLNEFHHTEAVKQDYCISLIIIMLQNSRTRMQKSILF